MSISAISGDEIDTKSLVGMTDYMDFVPSTTLLEFGAGKSQIIMRGIGISANEQSTVSTYFGEVPLTSPIRFGYSTDMKLVDMERIEILRGPQGTLYGSGAMGGTVRNIPKAPDLTQFEGDLEFGYGRTSGSSENNNKMVGVFNLPLVEDKLALRVSAYRFDNAGYVDLVSTPVKENLATTTGTAVAIEEDSGDHTYTGGRASLLWQFSDEFSLSLLYATQDVEEDGTVDVDSLLGGYRASELDINPFRTEEFEFTNLVLKYDLGWAKFLASSTQLDGYSDTLVPFDRFSPIFAAEEGVEFNKKGKIQEVRLTSQLEGDLQFVAGIYHEDFEWGQDGYDDWIGSQASFDSLGFLGSDLRFLRLHRDSELTQHAIFGELTYSINPSWDLTLGTRWFDYERRDLDNIAIFVPTVPDTITNTEETGTTSKVNITYSPDEQSMLYAQWAQGFRLGLGQVLPSASTCDIDNDGKLDFTDAPLDPSVDSDSTTNIELGGKFTFLDQTLTLNTSLYRIDWEDIPVQVIDTSSTCPAFQSVLANSGEARSQGVEVEANYYATSNLQLSLSTSYTDAEFLTDGIGNKGDRLPLSSKWNGTLGIEYSFYVVGYEAFIRSDYSYRSDHIVNAGQTQKVDGYSKWNMRAGITVNQFDIEVYGKNLANNDDFTTVFAFGSLGFRIPPRVVGLEMRYSF